MATNEMPFSHPISPDDVHGTGWHQDLAGQGKAGKRSFSQHRAAARIAQAPPRFQQMRAIGSPLEGDRVQGFVDEFVANERGGTGFLSSKIVNAIRRNR